MSIAEEALQLHEKLKGKIELQSKMPIRDRHDLSLAYTPGVAEPCRRIAKSKEDVYKYTMKGNTIAVISDGSAVLGLGNIGPEAALPVMEGKAMLFKELAGINAMPICLATQNTKEVISIIRNLAPVFGGINLEDIKAPQCFEVEAALQDLNIPVMHDDQHCTAVVVLAALINALKVVGKNILSVRIVINGAGAAGTGIAKILLLKGCSSDNLIVCDSKGIVYAGREDLAGNPYKNELASLTNKGLLKGSLADAVAGADIFIGVSVKDALSQDMVRSMARDAIVIAMANPDPEIMPDLARQAGAKIVATGRSDFPNQVNNILGFPGLFKGALAIRAAKVTDGMKLAAAEALAAIVENPSADEILPSPLDKRVVLAVAGAVTSACSNEAGCSLL